MSCLATKKHLSMDIINFNLNFKRAYFKPLKQPKLPSSPGFQPKALCKITAPYKNYIKTPSTEASQRQPAEKAREWQAKNKPPVDTLLLGSAVPLARTILIFKIFAVIIVFFLVFRLVLLKSLAWNACCFLCITENFNEIRLSPLRADKTQIVLQLSQIHES